METEKIRGMLRTRHDELSFSNGDAFANSEGNVCISFNADSYALLTPLMAKRLRKALDEAIGSALGLMLGEE